MNHEPMRMTIQAVVKHHALAGFDLCGWKRADGTIQLGPSLSTHGEFIEKWPDEVEVHGTVYTFEGEDWQSNGFGWGHYV